MGIKFIFFSLFFFFSSPVAFSSSVQGEGQFVAREGDSLSFIKDQLLANAIRDVITRELRTMGLSPDAFWGEYERRFEEFFKQTIEELNEKYGVREGESLRPERERAYQDELRQRRLQARVNFGRLNQIVPSYSIQRMSRSTQNPNFRHMSLEAQVDRDLLSRMFYQYTQGQEDRDFKHLFVSTEFHLSQMTWQDTGVMYGKDFIDVVNEHWLKWMNDHLAHVVDSSILSTPEMDEKINNFLRASPELQGAERGGLTQSSDEQILSQSLWLKVRVNLRKIDERAETQVREFEIDGEFLLIDLQTGKLVLAYDFDKIFKTVSMNDPHQLSSDLASMVYRLPMARLDRFSRTANNYTSKKQSFTLEVEHANSINDLFQVSELIAQRGAAVRAQPQVSSLSQNKGKINLTFQGSEEQVLQILRSLHRSSIGNKSIYIPTGDGPVRLELRGS